MSYQRHLTRDFKTIYIEEAAFGYDIAKHVLERHKDTEVVIIRSYKDVFNRSRQHFGIQKIYPSLILAVKKDNFIYRGSNLCQSFGYSNTYYATLILNCIYDCEYCFLQGMYNSAYIVAFVNTDDFLNEFSQLNDSYIALSYETDLIASHGIVPYIDLLYDSFRTGSNVVEIRTKSANMNFFKEHEPIDNLIMAFTLTPDEVINRFEKYTPSLKARIKAVNTAIDRGFKVRLCFDPVFADEADIYKGFYDHIFTQIDSSKVIDIGYGFFRMPKDYFSKISKKSDSAVFVKDFVTEDNSVTYPEMLREETIKKHLSILEKYIVRGKIWLQ